MKPRNAFIIFLILNCAAVGLAGPLTCLSLLSSNATISSSSSSNPLIKNQTVVARAAADGEVCFRYIARCTTNSTACSAEQVAEGIWRWAYGSMPLSACEFIATNANDNIQYAQCCSSNHCNTPDPALDPETRVDPSVQLSSPAVSEPVAATTAISEPVAATTAAVVDATASETTPGDHSEALVNTSSVDVNSTQKAPMKSAAALINFWPASAHINKVSVPKQAGVYKQPKGPAGLHKQQQNKNHPQANDAKNSDHKSKSSSSSTTNHKGNSPRLPHQKQQNSNSKFNPSKKQQPQQQHRQQTQHNSKHMTHGSQIQSLICFRNVPRDRHLAPAVAPREFRKSDGVDMCGRYKFQCANGDNTCTATEVRERVWKWAYMPLSSHTCMELKAYSNRQNSVIQHVQCCSSDHCNRPNSNLDRLTKVITQTAAGLYGKNQPNVKSQTPRPAGRTLMEAAPASASTIADVTSAQQQQPEGLLRPTRLACFTSMPRSVGQVPSVMPRVYHKSDDGVEVCSRYQLQCSQDRRAACTAAEIEAKSWIWEYKPLSASLCREMKAIAATGVQSGYRSVICCSGNACNRPDAAEDPMTKVVRGETVELLAEDLGSN